MPTTVGCQHADSADPQYFIIAQCAIVCLIPTKGNPEEKHKPISRNQKA